MSSPDLTSHGRRAKLVCTLGPATATPEAVRALIDAGMDVARVNFSHGTDDDHARAVRLVREATAEAGRVVATLADLSGPKIRLGEIRAGHLHLEPGARFLLRSDGRPGDATGASTTYPGLGADLRPGDRVLLADGAVELIVREVGADVVTEVVKSLRKGRVGTRSGVNVPSERMSLPAITDKDRADLVRALDLGFDTVAQSFVRSADDVRELRALMGRRRVPIVAKLENRSAVENAEAIIRTADAIMVARGDLGVEIELEEIPIVQKEIISLCRRTGTPSVVATQMLESMVTSPKPTRAEVSDAANAILDGADAVLLSAETAVGEFPVEAAAAAAKIAGIAEQRGRRFRLRLPKAETGTTAQAIARAAVEVTETDLDVSAIACFTRTGRTAMLVAAERPEVPVYAFSPEERVARGLAGVWGLTPCLSDAPDDVDGLIAMIDKRLVADGLVEEGRTIVLVGAAPVGRAHTNLLKVHVLGSPAYRS